MEKMISSKGRASACSISDAMPIVVVRRFGAREIAPQGQEVESARTS